MSRTKSTKVVLDASAGDAVGEVIACTDAHALALFVGFKIVASAADLLSTVTFVGNVEDDGAYASWPAIADGELVSVSADEALTYAAATGELDTAAGLALGTYRGVIRFVNPPPYVVPIFDYTSGGGTYSVVLKASY